MWVRPWTGRRKEQGALYKLVQELEGGDREMYKRYFLMNRETFHLISKRVEPLISKQDTHGQYQQKRDWQLPFDF